METHVPFANLAHLSQYGMRKLMGGQVVLASKMLFFVFHSLPFHVLDSHIFLHVAFCDILLM